jgi:four helix bundle protein
VLYKPTYKKTAFRVKKPIRSFRDLEVYQSTSSYATEVITKIVPLLNETAPVIKDKLIESCLKIPELIAASHSRRFEAKDELKTLDEALETCNKVVVYLEQARDIYVKAIEERAACEDLIKRYIFIRRKIFNLYKAWKKFEPHPPF